MAFSKTTTRCTGLLLALLLACSVAIAPADVGQAHAATPHETGVIVTTQAATYPIVYKLNGGTQAKNQITTLKKGQTLKASKLKKPTRARYQFLGWYSNRALTAKATTLKGVSKAAKRTVYAKWKLKSYNILYSMNGGVFSGKYTKTVGKNKTIKVSKIAKPKRNGYTFVGWYTDKKLKTKAKAVRGVADSSKRTLYAKWATKTYTISYEPNGGQLPAKRATSYKTSKGTSLPTPRREGYSFIGWYTEPELVNHVYAIEANDYGDRKLYARWEKRIAVAHRGYYADGAAQNSVGAYEAAAAKGFTYVETDIRFTKDNQAVLSHDNYKKVFAKDAEGNPYGDSFNLTISSVTLAELQSNYIAVAPSGSAIAVAPASDAETPGQAASPQGQDDSQNSDADGSKAQENTVQYRNVSEFGEFLDTCQNLNLIPKIELKEGTQEQVESLVAAVDERKMTHSVHWISFQPKLLKYVQTIHPESTFVVLGTTASSTKVKNARLLGANGGKVSIGSQASKLTDEQVTRCQKAGIPLGVWSLSNETKVVNYPQYVNSFTLDGLVADHLPEIL